MAGRARARVDGSAVILQLLTSEWNARALLNAWPPMEAPPWLGHGEVMAVEAGRDAVRVEFAEGTDPPLLLFADPRLAPWSPLHPDSALGDDRDRVDQGGSPFHTYDERTVGYARSLGRPVTPRRFDRRYYLVLAQPVAEEVGASVAQRIGQAWV
ncbi:MAG: hypothetical protein HKO53_02370, partial [Gemmatimonadetes bacterium]|nr:hypothetical protein [Gemmatimonadota bacterium]